MSLEDVELRDVRIVESINARLPDDMKIPFMAGQCVWTAIGIGLDRFLRDFRSDCEARNFTECKKLRDCIADLNRSLSIAIKEIARLKRRLKSTRETKLDRTPRWVVPHHTRREMDL